MATTFPPGPAAVLFEARGVRFYHEYGGPRPAHAWEWGVMIRKWSAADNGYINVAIVDEYPPASIPANSGYPQTLAGARAKLVDDLVKELNLTIATHAPAPGTPIFPDPNRQGTYDYILAHTLYTPATATWSKK